MGPAIERVLIYTSIRVYILYIVSCYIYYSSIDIALLASAREDSSATLAVRRLIGTQHGPCYRPTTGQSFIRRHHRRDSSTALSDHSHRSRRITRSSPETAGHRRISSQTPAASPRPTRASPSRLLLGAASSARLARARARAAWSRRRCRL